MKKLLFLTILLLASLLLVACGNHETTAEETTSEAPVTTAPITTEEDSNVIYKTVKNPVASNANDPWIVSHEGKYYYCWSGNGGVAVAEIPSLDKISYATRKAVYVPPQGTMYSHEYWAPELHYIQGEWYIYVAADDGKNENHRMYVLKGTSQDPTDPFEFVGQITDPTNKWAIDGTVVTIKDELYFVWSGWEGDENVAQNLYIAHMSNPWTIDSERTMISAPIHGWEKIGDPKVNEGPTALYNGDDVHIIYSGSGSWTDDYCMGLLTLTGEDPLDAASWKKNGVPIMRKKPGVAYGPGHCSVTTAVDGSLWMIYHANLESGTSWGGRSCWIAPITFDKNGKPVVGKMGYPQAEVEFPIGLKP